MYYVIYPVALISLGNASTTSELGLHLASVLLSILVILVLRCVVCVVPL